MAFYKMQDNEMTFQLLNEESWEHYSIYDTVKKAFLGKDDVLEGSNGALYIIPQTKTIPKVDFEAMFPHKRKTTTFIRDVAINGEKYAYAFTYGVEKLLKGKITDAKAFGVDCREFRFTLKKTGEGLNTKYMLMVGDRVGLPNVQEPKKEQPTMPARPTPSTPPTPPFNPFAQPQAERRIGALDTVMMLGDLSEEEQALLDFAERSPDKLTEVEFITRFITALKDYYNIIADKERAVQIYRQLYVGNPSHTLVKTN